MEEKISVIIPIYNVDSYLKRCLDSVRNNTYRNLEIICIDDGSTDECKDILKEYESIDNRIIVLTKENGGVSSARNKGLELCSGTFIAFIDSDDWIHKNYFSLMMEVQEQKDYDIVVCDFYRTEDNNILNNELNTKDYIDMNKSSYYLNHNTKSFVWGRIYKKSIIKNIKFDEKEKMEDALYNTLVMLENSKLNIAFLKSKLYAYFYRTGSLGSNINSESAYKLGERYYLLSKTADNETKNLLLIDALKRTLSARYGFGVTREKERAKQSDRLAKGCLRNLSREKLKYILLVYFPFLYRWYRVHQDPTLLTWEKSLKHKHI